jgi:hypothetical protein
MQLIRNGSFDFFHDRNCDVDVNQRTPQGLHRRGSPSCDLLIDETWRLDTLRELLARSAQEGSGSEGDAGESWRIRRAPRLGTFGRHR